jgi:threonine/homoserine/homoserine lactone efflux protein
VGTGACDVAHSSRKLFFASILPQFVDTREPLARQVAILGLTSVIAEFFVLAA